MTEKQRRGPDGRFLSGGKSSGGRPQGSLRKYSLEYIEILHDALTPGIWRDIVLKACDQAKNGNKDARKWLSDYALGPAALVVQAVIATTTDTSQLDANVSRMLSIISAARGTIEGESIVIEDKPSDT